MSKPKYKLFEVNLERTENVRRTLETTVTVAIDERMLVDEDGNARDAEDVIADFLNGNEYDAKAQVKKTYGDGHAKAVYDVAADILFDTDRRDVEVIDTEQDGADDVSATLLDDDMGGDTDDAALILTLDK